MYLPSWFCLYTALVADGFSHMQQEIKLGEQLKQAWYGKESLWKVFWIYGVLVKVFLYVLILGLQYSHMGIPTYKIAYIITWPIGILYSIWLCISVWKCAYNLDERLRVWGHIARIVAVYWGITQLSSSAMIFYYLTTRGL